MKKEINKPDGAKTKQITLVVNGNLHRDLKLLSIQSNQTLQSIVERMLRYSGRATQKERYQV